MDKKLQDVSTKFKVAPRLVQSVRVRKRHARILHLTSN